MEEDLVRKIKANPKYAELVSKRSSFGWLLTIIMLVVYYGFIAVIAFNKQLFAAKLGVGVMTVGVPVGFGVIVFTIVITGIYVARANSEYDELTKQIVQEVA